jgi:hypothetical protein
MRQSATRIRSLYTRYAAAEAAAFPGIRPEGLSFPYTKLAMHFRESRPRVAQTV